MRFFGASPWRFPSLLHARGEITGAATQRSMPSAQSQVSRSPAGRQGKGASDKRGGVVPVAQAAGEVARRWFGVKPVLLSWRAAWRRLAPAAMALSGDVVCPAKDDPSAERFAGAAPNRGPAPTVRRRPSRTVAPPGLTPARKARWFRLRWLAQEKRAEGGGRDLVKMRP